MKRHLKIRGELILGSKQVKITVISQTATGNNFGNRAGTSTGLGWTGYRSCCFKHNNVILISHPVCALEYDHKCLSKNIDTNNWVMLKSDRVVDTNGYMLVPLKLWPEIKEAVEAYNKWGDAND